MHNLATASQILGLSIPAIKKRIYQGKLNAYKIKGYNNRETWVVELPLLHNVNTLFHKWLDDLTHGNGYAKSYSLKTVKSYKEGFYALWKQSGETPCLSKWTVSLIKKAFSRLLQSQTCRYSSKLRMLDAYRSFSHWLIKQGIKDPCVLDGVKSLTPKRHTPAKRHKIQQHQVQGLLQAIQSYYVEPFYKRRMNLLINLLLSSGLRISEALSLKVTDIDFEKRQIAVVGKGNKPRITVLSPKVHVLLLEWLKSHYKGSTLFNGWTYKGALIALRRLKAHLPFDVCFHGLRRTCATQWVEHNVPITMVSKLLGHSSLKTTQLYVEADAIDAVKAVKHLDLY